jgi:hypothetical protein
MTSNTAPSPNFTGINFNTDFFPSALGDFVEYPVAQGPTTIATLYSSVIDTLSSSTAFNFLNTLTANLNIAINGGAGQTIRIGATTGTSVHCANVDFQNHSINNSTNASGGNINICNSMTSGTLNLGTNTARSGTIHIGNGAGATGTIDIGSSTTTTTLNGTSVKATTKLITPIIDCVTDAGAGNTSLAIGPSATSGNIIIGASLGVGDVAIGAFQSTGGTITLGSASTVTTLNGTTTLTSPLTLPTTWTAPTSTQLGYITNVLTGGVTYSIGSANNATQITTFNMPIGTFIVYWSSVCLASTYYTIAINLGSPSITAKYAGCVLTTTNAGVTNPKINMSAIVQNSFAQQWYLAHQATNIVTSNITDVYLYYVRIA